MKQSVSKLAPMSTVFGLICGKRLDAGDGYDHFVDGKVGRWKTLVTDRPWYASQGILFISIAANVDEFAVRLLESDLPSALVFAGIRSQPSKISWMIYMALNLVLARIPNDGNIA